MTAPKSNVDLFGSYLSRVRAAPEVPEGRGEEAGTEIELLKEIKAQGTNVSIRTLMDRVKLPPSSLIRMLATLREAKLLEMSANADDEAVALTELGRKLID